MDYFEGVVVDYLRADRAVFVNTECCIQLNDGDNPDTSGPHWYCDAVAVNHREKKIYLCEITYARGLSAVGKRLSSWSTNWEALRAALIRDCSLPPDWPVQPWVFTPTSLVPVLEKKMSQLFQHGVGAESMPYPRVTPLELVLPWKYRSWNHQPCDSSALLIQKGFVTSEK